MGGAGACTSKGLGGSAADAWARAGLPPCGVKVACALEREAAALVTDPRTSNGSQTQGNSSKSKEAQLYAAGCDL